MMGASLALGSAAVIAVFAVLSCLAAIELAGAPRWPLCILTALQYALVWTGSYPLFAIALPLVASFYFPVRAAVQGETKDFVERTSGSAWALIVCAYGVSYAPALLSLDIPRYQGGNATLLFYFLLVVQSSDVFQYCWGKLAGRTKIAPRVSPNKTWEGFLGGVLTSTAVGAALYRATPFSFWEAAAVCAAITLLGFAGGLAMSACKRDRGIKDFGTLVSGHGGVLDRLDSICFSAPAFFYLVKYFHGA
jgi:phosphatidate cytidylyltransferase